jgi:xanthine dehydrogenase accessory factor
VGGVYEIALTVTACLRSGTAVDVAWAVETRGFSSRDRNEALALTPGGGRVGSVLSGSLNEELADLASGGSRGRLLDLRVGDLAASSAGLSCGGDARCVLVSATELPGALWDHLRNRDAVCLVSAREGDRIGATAMFTAASISEAPPAAQDLFRQGTSATGVLPDSVVSVFRPVPKLALIGAGAICEALQAAGGLLGWHTQAVTDASSAAGVVAGLAAMDNLVVLSHDDDVAGTALETALAGDVGYIGALGSRRTQQSRAQWLADRGVTDLRRVYGPAGLDVGATTPAEIAIAIVAEALSVRSGSVLQSLRDRTGSIH